MLGKDDLTWLAEIVNGSNILLLADEVYEHIVFDGRAHRSLALHPRLKERSFVVGSFGKTFHVTGWKIGYCMAPHELTGEFRKMHRCLTFCTITPVQLALADYLKTPEYYLSVSDFYQRKRDLFVQALKGSRFTFTPSQGSYFQNLSYAHISNEADVDWAVRQTKEDRRGVHPVVGLLPSKKRQQGIALLLCQG